MQQRKSERFISIWKFSRNYWEKEKWDELTDEAGCKEAAEKVRGNGSACLNQKELLR